MQLESQQPTSLAARQQMFLFLLQNLEGTMINTLNCTAAETAVGTSQTSVERRMAPYMWKMATSLKQSETESSFAAVCLPAEPVLQERLRG